MAAARQEFGRTPTLNKAVDPVTTSADVEPAANVTALAAAAAPTARRRHPADAAAGRGCSTCPSSGRSFVTPIVAVIHQIPIVGDVLHPFIGYPVQPGAPGTPVPRDVKVISFDGTPIYVHFMPAVGLPAGQKAPTILDGPGLAAAGRDEPRRRVWTDSSPNDVGRRRGAARTPGTTSSPGTRVVSGTRAARCSSTLRTTRARTSRRSSAGWRRSRRSDSTTPPRSIRGSAWSARPTAAASNWHRGHRPPGRRDRADHRMAHPDHVAVQGRGVQERLGHLLAAALIGTNARVNPGSTPA